MATIDARFVVLALAIPDPASSRLRMAVKACLTSGRTHAETRAVPRRRTSETIHPDPFARAAAVRSWRQRPDFVLVNLSESGWAGVVRAALHAGMGVEAGLATPADAAELARSSNTLLTGGVMCGRDAVLEQ